MVGAVVAVIWDCRSWRSSRPTPSRSSTSPRAAVGAGAAGLTLVNTLLGLGIDADTRRPRLGGVTGGYSGPPIKPVALRVVHEVTRALPGVPVIGTGGVSTGTDAAEMLLAGAHAVGVGTASFLEPRAVNRIHDELLVWCADHGVTRVSDLTGALEAMPDPSARKDDV